MIFEKNNACCGISEFTGMNYITFNITKIIKRFWFVHGGIMSWKDYPSAVLFTEAGSNKRYKFARSKRLAKFIRRHKLGTVAFGPARLNYGSGNWVKLVVWFPVSREQFPERFKK